MAQGYDYLKKKYLHMPCSAKFRSSFLRESSEPSLYGAPALY